MAVSRSAINPARASGVVGAWHHWRNVATGTRVRLAVSNMSGKGNTSR